MVFLAKTFYFQLEFKTLKKYNIQHYANNSKTSSETQIQLTSISSLDPTFPCEFRPQAPA
jgi:hypothetical protein